MINLRDIMDGKADLAIGSFGIPKLHGCDGKQMKAGGPGSGPRKEGLGKELLHRYGMDKLSDFPDALGRAMRDNDLKKRSAMSGGGPGSGRRKGGSRKDAEDVFGPSVSTKDDRRWDASDASDASDVKAYGTSQGVSESWDTRRGGGGSDRDKPGYRVLQSPVPNVLRMQPDDSAKGRIRQDF